MLLQLNNFQQNDDIASTVFERRAPEVEYKCS